MTSKFSHRIKPPVSTEKYKLWLCFVPIAPLWALGYFWYRWHKFGFLPSFYKTAVILALVYIAFAPLFFLAIHLSLRIHWTLSFLMAYGIQTATTVIWRELEYRRLTKEIQQYKATAAR